MSTTKDPFLALMLEVAGSFFGVLGIGWIYTGRVVEGLLILIGYWLLAGTITVMLVIASLGLWCFVLPAQNLVFGALSGYLVYRRLQER